MVTRLSPPREPGYEARLNFYSLSTHLAACYSTFIVGFGIDTFTGACGESVCTIATIYLDFTTHTTHFTEVLVKAFQSVLLNS